MPGQESDRGYTSYAGSCSVHGTLKRHISSGIDTTMEDDVFDDFSHGTETKKNGQPGYPIHTGEPAHSTHTFHRVDASIIYFESSAVNWKYRLLELRLTTLALV